MLRRVRIKSVPKARTGYQVKGALVNDVPAFGGADYNAYIGEKPSEVKKTIGAVPREMANLEAEGGETVIGNIDGSSMPSFYTIKGPRHSSGGVPLNLPDDSFIFSDTRSMKITDSSILKMFNAKPKKGGYTPAELSKKYDINKYRKILQDPNSDKMDRKTAEMMIKNYTMKLGALALAQESKKGFPQGIPEMAKPYMEANKISEEDLLPQKEQPQAQPMMQQGQMPEDQMEQEMPEGAPTEMPNGEQIAQPQSMEQDMAAQQMMGQQQPPMAYGGIPFAAYGIEMGGYDFPYHPSEMAYGGYLPKAQDGIPVKSKSKEQLEAELRGGKATVTKTKKLPDGTTEITRADGTKVYAKGSQGDVILREDPKAPGKVTRTAVDPAKYKKDICARIKAEGYTAEQAAKAGWIHVSQVGAFKGCENLKRSEVDKSEFYELEEAPKDCPCLDDKGVAIPGKFAQKDPATGECKPETCKPKERCECEKADGTKYDPGMNDDGTCKDCEEPEEEMSIQQQERGEPEWWLQDTVNTMGAFGDMMSLKKYMPWEARVDLEEPRPTFLDPTRELAAQSEQANIASQAAASFAGPQALNARLSQIQGQGAAQAANTLANINNQNVNIANQFEANQVGVRNQEQMLNQQMANRVYDKNVVANQQFDNAKRQGMANMRQAYNNAVTNRWKTDALNQMYPNYQTRPGVGGRVEYTPTDKQVDPGAKTSTYGEKLKDLMSQGFSRETAEKMIMNEHKATYSQKGGSTPGYIYTDWPIFL
jgi:hypothetical protein